MNQPIEVNVTAEDIANGKPRHCGECPIAIAATRAAGMEVRVGGFWAYTAPAVRAGWTVSLPPIAREFIRAFDWGEPVEPFSFTLGIPT